MTALGINLVSLKASPQWLPQNRTARGPAAIASPDQQVQLAARYLAERVPEEVRPHGWFLSFHALPSDRADLFLRVMAWWLNQMSWEQEPALPLAVPGSGGRLWFVDVRDYRWNAKARNAVAARDLKYDEVWAGRSHSVSPTESDAQWLRREMGCSIPTEIEAKGRYPIMAVVDGSQLFRDTVESERNPSYYDLLFAHQRHVKGKVNFPEGEDDWNEAFGIDAVKKYARGQELDLEFGAIVDGGAEKPQGGSIVALHNRILETDPTPFGVAMKSWDVKKGTGRKNYTESLIFGEEGFLGKQGPYLKGRGVKAEFDANEFLAYLPNGGQAAMLGNGQRQRIERADADVAQDTADKRLNPGVRNPGSCVGCHGPALGYIYPKNKIEEAEKRGLLKPLEASDKARAKRIRGFFTGWKGRIAGYTAPYASLIARTTLDPNGKPLTAKELVDGFMAFRNYYDDPLTVAQAAAEVGVDPRLFRVTVGQSPRLTADLLVTDEPVARSVWDEDLYRDCQLLFAADRRQPLLKIKPAPATPVAPPQAGPVDPAPAKLVVKLPANAKLWVDGKLVKQWQTERVLTTPPLEPGHRFTYDLTAEWGGRRFTRQVKVRAGETTRVNFER